MTLFTFLSIGFALVFLHGSSLQVTAASPSQFFKFSAKEPEIRHSRKIEKFRRNIPLPHQHKNFTKRFASSRISGGYVASDDIANSVAYIYIINRSSPDVFFSCTGSILTPWLILTAAHCFEGKNYNFDVFYVEVSLGKFGPSGIIYDVRYVDIFKNYKSGTLQNDIALIWIFGTISAPFKAVSMPDPSFSVAPKTTVYAAGFGKTSTNGPTSSILLEAELLYQSFGKCVKRSSFSDRKTMFKTQILCATTPDYPNSGNADTCPGDSGGPLYIKSGSEMQQHGITSYGIETECGKPNSVSWFTNLKTYVPFIKDHVNGDFGKWNEVYG